MTFRDRFEERVVGDRCPSDPCASNNGLKRRVYAVIMVPAAVLVLATFPFETTSAIGRGLVTAGVAWTVGSAILVGRWCDDLEPCDDVEEHYGEGSSEPGAVSRLVERIRGGSP